MKLGFFSDLPSENTLNLNTLLQTNQVYLLDEAQFFKKSKKGTYQQSTFQLYFNFLVKLNINNEVQYVRDITNFSLTLGFGNQYKYGLILSKKDKIIELWCQNKNVFNSWLDDLKSFVVQTNFQENYKLSKQIGEGSFAKVYKVRSRQNNQEFAAKVFEKTLMKNPDVEKNSLMKEISILRKMNHPGIIKLHEVYESQQNIILIFDLLKGGELLKQLKKSQGHSEEQIAIIMARLLDSIDYMHTRNIMHRDLKPENLILRNKDFIEDLVIADFGLADYYDPEGKYLFKRCGTPGYVAPEVLQDKIYDTKVDIFSAGTIMFILLSGALPFVGNSYDEIVRNNYHCIVDYGQNNLQSKVSKEVLNLLSSLLNPLAAQRPTAKEALQHPWFLQALSGSQQKLKQLQMIDDLPTFKPNHTPFTQVKTPLMNYILSINNTPQQFTPDLAILNMKVLDKNEILKLNLGTIHQKTQLSPQIEQLIEDDLNQDEIDESHQSSKLPQYKLQGKFKQGFEEKKKADTIRSALQQFEGNVTVKNL